MKVMVIGASGTVGRSIVENLSKDHDVITVGKNQGDLQVDLTNQSSVTALFEQSGQVDGIIAAVGGVFFGPLSAMTDSDFLSGLQDKLMGQVRLVLTGQKYLNKGGSFTLTTGILTQHPIRDGVNATSVNGALESFVLAAANELNGQRINAVSPTVLTESLDKYGPFFKGIESVPASRVAMAYRRSLEGVETGQVYRVW